MTPVTRMIGGVDALSTKPVVPERELLIATLERAVLDYYGNGIGFREEAEIWLFGESDPTEPFAFEWICDHLHLNPYALRQRIRHLSIPTDVAQAHRWIRTKVQSRDADLARPAAMRMSA